MRMPFQKDITTILVRQGGVNKYSLLIGNILAILELSEHVYFNKNIRPICLPRRRVTANYNSILGFISGWGKTGRTKNDWSTNLKEAAVLIFGTDFCKKIMNIQGKHAWESSMGYNSISE